MPYERNPGYPNEDQPTDPRSPEYWSLERVINLLQNNQFPPNYITTFQKHNICHQAFFDCTNQPALTRLGLDNQARFINLVRTACGLPVRRATGANQPSFLTKRSSFEKYLFLNERLRPTRQLNTQLTIMITLDSVVFTLVGISECNNAQQVREKVCKVADLDPSLNPTFHVTDYFCVPGSHLNDSQLWSILAAASGDLVKFYIGTPHSVQSRNTSAALLPYESMPHDHLRVPRQRPRPSSDNTELESKLDQPGMPPMPGGPPQPRRWDPPPRMGSGGSSTPPLRDIPLPPPPPKPVVPEKGRSVSDDTNSASKAKLPIEHRQSSLRAQPQIDPDPNKDLPPRPREELDQNKDLPLEPREQLVAKRSAPPPPTLLRKASSKYKPSLGSTTARGCRSLLRKPVPNHEQAELTSTSTSSSNMWSDAPGISDIDEEDEKSGLWAKVPQPPSSSESSDSIRSSPTSPMSANANSAPLSARTTDSGSNNPFWLGRPATEVVYDNLEQFFPDTDLDKPVILATKSRSNASPVEPLRSTQRKTAEVGRMKSIRVVAREASQRQKSAKVAPLLRRKSTKMWGQSVVEMRKGNALSLRDQKEYVWIRGKLLGRGSFGAVYMGLNVTTGDMLAVKQVEIPAWYDKNEGKVQDAVKSLYLEVENMKNLDHENIVQYLGFEARENVNNLFLEYVSGGSIKSILDHFGRFDEPMIRYLNKQILDGLAYLHSQNILHRDLKADNLLLEDSGNLKISDFGISKKSRDIYSNDAEMSMQGTIFWMAPEVIHSVVMDHRQGYSAKVDVWSLGCVILEMYAGRRPWSTEEAVGAMYKLGSSKEAPPIPEDTKEFVSKLGQSFIDSCFVINPSRRPTARELLGHPFAEQDPRFNFGQTKLGELLAVSANHMTLLKEEMLKKTNPSSYMVSNNDHL